MSPPGETGREAVKRVTERPLDDVVIRGTGMSELDGGWPWRPPKPTGDGVLDHNADPRLWGKPST